MTRPIPLESLLSGPPKPADDRIVPGPYGPGSRPEVIELPIGPPVRVDDYLADVPRGTWSKKWRLLKAYLTGQPVWVTWQVTYNCNYGCSFCTYWQNDFKPEEENSLEDFVIGSRKLSEMGSLIVSLAGGEPMLRRDIHRIVSILAQDHFPYMTTSGSGMTSRRARQIWEAGLWGCSISIDYADPEKHARHRGVKFAFERAVKAIEQLMDARTDTSYQRVQIISVLTDDNLGEMPALCQLARDLGVYWQVQPYSIMKTGNENQRHLVGASEMLLGLKELYPETVHSNRVYLERFDEAANDGIGGCIAGKAMFNIDNRMIVSKCVEFNESEPLGSLRTDSMEVVLARLRASHAANTCTACWYSCRGEVEVLYTARGFVNSLPSLLWQSGGEQARTG